MAVHDSVGSWSLEPAFRALNKKPHQLLLSERKWTWALFPKEFCAKNMYISQAVKMGWSNGASLKTTLSTYAHSYEQLTYKYKSRDSQSNLLEPGEIPKQQCQQTDIRNRASHRPNNVAPEKVALPWRIEDSIVERAVVASCQKSIRRTAQFPNTNWNPISQPYWSQQKTSSAHSARFIPLVSPCPRR